MIVAASRAATGGTGSSGREFASFGSEEDGLLDAEDDASFE